MTCQAKLLGAARALPVAGAIGLRLGMQAWASVPDPAHVAQRDTSSGFDASSAIGGESARPSHDADPEEGAVMKHCLRTVISVGLAAAILAGSATLAESRTWPQPAPLWHADAEIDGEFACTFGLPDLVLLDTVVNGKLVPQTCDPTLIHNLPGE
jgi:hypothetical protein